MSCPLHIWLPLMGAAAPFVRVARDKYRALRSSSAEPEEAPRELKRWAPVGQVAPERTESN